MTTDERGGMPCMGECGRMMSAATWARLCHRRDGFLAGTPQPAICYRCMRTGAMITIPGRLRVPAMRLLAGLPAPGQGGFTRN